MVVLKNSKNQYLNECIGKHEGEHVGDLHCTNIVINKIIIFDFYVIHFISIINRLNKRHNISVV